MNIGERLLQNTIKRDFTPCLFSSKRFLPVRGLPALLTALLILVSCDGDVPVSSSPAISFRTPAVFKSKMLYETQRTVQSYTNELLVNGKPVDDGYIADVTYTITEPADYAAKGITLNEKTGELRFKNIPAAVTVQAAHPRVGTAAYTFTVTDHFSKRNHYSSVVLGSGIYVIGGSGEAGGGSNDVWKSSDGGAAWTQVTTAASTRFSKRRSHSSVVLNDAIYVIGGFDSGIVSLLNDVWKSTDGGRNWVKVPTTGTIFSPRHRHSSVVLGSDIYVIGGSNGTRPVDDIIWKSGDGGVSWQPVPTTGITFSPRSSPGSVVLGSDIYVIGGENHFTRSFDNQVWKSSNGGAAWTQIKAAGAEFSERYAHSSVTDGSAIYVIGGVGAGAARFNEVWKSTNGGVTWTQAAKTSARFPPRYSHSSVVLNDTIYVIGGHTSDFTNDVWKSEDGGAAWKNVHAAP